MIHKSQDAYIHAALMKRLEGAMLIHPNNISHDVLPKEVFREEYHSWSFGSKTILNIYNPSLIEALRKEGAIMRLKELWAEFRRVRPLDTAIIDYAGASISYLKEIMEIAQDFEIDLNSVLDWDAE